MSPQQAQWWLPLALFLVLASAVGGVLLYTSLRSGQPVEIVLPTTPPTPVARQVYIGGAVANPGVYPLQGGDGLDDLLKAAGGVTSQADPQRLRITVPRFGEDSSPQKIDINRAEPWLLEALPDIGPKLAQAIVDYRTQNGPFRTVEDMRKVPGIGPATLNKIKDKITVGD